MTGSVPLATLTRTEDPRWWLASPITTHRTPREMLHGGDAYIVTYCEHFQVDDCTVTFCVKRWPDRPRAPGSYELFVEIELPASNAVDQQTDPRPSLIWDAAGSPVLDWSPPPLPVSDSCHEEDYAQRCVVTRFVAAAPRRWRLTLVWPCDGGGPKWSPHGAPQRIVAMVDMPYGRRIGDPATGKSFHIPLVEDACGSPGAELREALAEVSRQRERCRQAEATATSAACRAGEIRAMLAQRPSADTVSALEAQLNDEVSLRERWRAEIEELWAKSRNNGNLAPKKQVARLAEEKARLMTELMQERARVDKTQQVGVALSGTAREAFGRKEHSKVTRLEVLLQDQIAERTEALRSVEEHRDREEQISALIKKLLEEEQQRLEMYNRMKEQEEQINALNKKLFEEERQRREMHNRMQELKGNIRVVGRSRPPFEEDAALALRVSEGTGKMAVTHGEETYTFELGNVFGGTSTQERMYDEVGGLVQSALDGYKVCIFAYGQTGSGKTFTMQGSKGANEGIIPRALTQIFNSTEAMRAKGWLWTLEASFLEVYNEQFRDLLVEGSAADPQPIHAILQDEARGPSVSNLTVVNVDSIAQIQRLMEKAAKHRTVGRTDMNAVASRSHAIFALYLKGSNAEDDTELTGALHLVDLAGSERLTKSNATGSRLKETCNINKSLSCLTDVFLAKQEESRGERSHIPFRNSKLTHLMESCLSGHGKTLMVLNVAPEETHAHETLTALRFAEKVAQCNTGGQPKRSAKTLSDRQTAPTNRAGYPCPASSSAAGGKAAGKGGA